MQKGSFANPAFAIASLAVVTILIKLPTLGTPAYWDEMGWLFQAHLLSEGGLLRAIPGFRSPAEFWGHPPGLHLILAIPGKVFGVSLKIAHVLIALFSALGVCATFLLARHWRGTGAGWLAAFFLLLSPVYLAQSGMFLADVPVTALGALATYFVLKNRYWPYLVCASCMVLLKETAIVLVVALLLYRFAVMNSPRETKLRDVARYSLPLAVIGAFILLQKATTGHFFFIYDYDVELFQLTPALMLYKSGLITQWIFIDQYRFVFTALIALKSAIDRIAGDHPAAQVLTTWPHTDELTRPLLGYVERPLHMKGFRDESDLADADVILVSHPANGPEVRLRELARTDAWQLIMRQGYQSAWVELYARPDPTAAQPGR